MEVVASHLVMRKFRTIKEFRMDLGISKTHEVQKEGNKGPGQVTIKIKDPFIKRYSLEKDVFLSKTGNIGTLSFYTDPSMMNDQFAIYDQNKEYNFTFKETGNVREFLSSVLDQVLGEENKGIELGVNLSENIEMSIDKNLPQIEFMEEYMKMRKKMDDLGIKQKR